MMNAYPMSLRPVLRDYIWGGERLHELFSRGEANTRIAESWELSTLPQGSSVVENGAFAGRSLRDVLGGELPVLVKLIDAARPLSVQVHPSDETVLAENGEHGKNELWLILSCREGASLYCGLTEPMSREKLRESAENNTLPSFLRRVEVHAGDIIPVPPGTIHAIGEGIVLAEVQQSSDTTFRLYDWGRLGADGKPRPLHLDRACAVARLTPDDAAVTSPVPSFRDGAGIIPLLKGEDFFSEKLSLDGETAVDARRAYRHLLVLSGRGELRFDKKTIPLSPGASWFLPRGTGVCPLIGTMELLVTGGKDE